MKKGLARIFMSLMFVFGLIACSSGGSSNNSTPATTTYSISGTVSLGSSGLQGVTMTLSGASAATVTTDTSGNYSFANLSNGSYTVTPNKTGYTFSPTSSTTTVNATNITAVNFTGIVTMTNASLNGTYKITNRTGGYFIHSAQSGTATYGTSYASIAAMTFDGNGNCTISISGSRVDESADNTGNGTVVLTPYTINESACTYSVASNGAVSFFGSSTNIPWLDTPTTGSLWLSADGNTLIGFGINEEPASSNSEKDTSLGVGVKIGTTMTNASLNGSYKITNQTCGYFIHSAQSGTATFGTSYVSIAAMTFDGNGNCTISISGSRVDESADNTGNGTVVLTPYTINESACTYSVASHGAVSFFGSSANIPWLDTPTTGSLWLSADGNTLIGFGVNEEPASSNSEKDTSLGVGVKIGTTMTNASLNGSYKITNQTGGYFIHSAQSGTATFGTSYASIAAMTFDGNGNCTISIGGTRIDESSDNTGNGTVVATPYTITGSSCTYSVASNGAVSFFGSSTNIPWLDTPTTGSLWLSADGNTLIGFGVNEEPASSNSEKDTSLGVGVKMQ